MESRYEFDRATILSAHAVGAPGKRTFFVAIGQGEEWVRIWLEKQDLQALALFILQLLVSVSGAETTGSGETEGLQEPGDPASKLPSAELEIDEITLGYADGRASLEVGAHGLGRHKSERVELRSLVGLAPLRAFAERSLDLCAAGRPRCILCGGPMDPAGHVCPVNN